MEKERKITAPEGCKETKVYKISAPNGCEIEKVEIVDGMAVVTFREKERKLPKSWEEFCVMFPMNAKECYIGCNSEITSFDPETEIPERNNVRDRNVLPDRATAEAVLALIQLIQLRNCFNGDWVPDWDGSKKIYFIIFDSFQNIKGEFYSQTPRSFLYFKTKDLRDEFLRCFHPLIEKLKPLYGIKEGGEE